MNRAIDIGYEVREYRDDDEQEVLGLLVSSLGEGPAKKRSSEFFRWKHIDNPFGRSLMLVAEQDGQLIGFRSFMRWELSARNVVVKAVRAVDTATHPQHQGRGVFKRLTLEALDVLRRDVDFVFNTPNDRSGPGYLKMGWVRAGAVPVAVRVRRPIAFVQGLKALRSGTPVRERPAVDAFGASAGLADESSVRALLTSLDVDDRLATPRTLEYLRWRYARAPLLGYSALSSEDGTSGGIAIFRVRARGASWETTVAEILVPHDDRSDARRLLGRVARAAAVDHVTAHFPTGSAPARAALGAGFLPSPRGVSLFVNPLAGNLRPAPAELSSWALTLGDLEVF